MYLYVNTLHNFWSRWFVIAVPATKATDDPRSPGEAVTPRRVLLFHGFSLMLLVEFFQQRLILLVKTIGHCLTCAAIARAPIE